MHTGKYAIQDYLQLRHVELGRTEVDYEFHRRCQRRAALHKKWRDARRDCFSFGPSCVRAEVHATQQMKMTVALALHAVVSEVG